MWVFLFSCLRLRSGSCDCYFHIVKKKQRERNSPAFPKRPWQGTAASIFSSYSFHHCVLIAHSDLWISNKIRGRQEWWNVRSYTDEARLNWNMILAAVRFRTRLSASVLNVKMAWAKLHVPECTCVRPSGSSSRAETWKCCCSGEETGLGKEWVLSRIPHKPEWELGLCGGGETKPTSQSFSCVTAADWVGVFVFYTTSHHNDARLSLSLVSDGCCESTCFPTSSNESDWMDSWIWCDFISTQLKKSHEHCVLDHSLKIIPLLITPLKSNLITSWTALFPK